MKVRFAPSPTGWLHVGRARVALVNWLLARRHGGTFLLRLDDTDAERGTAAYAQGVFDDLGWLGLDWDETYRQSERLDRYAEARARLVAAGRLYACFESEEELRAKRDRRAKRGQAPVYDREMLRLTAAQRAAAEAGGKRPYFRFRLSDGEAGWTDLIGGRHSVKLTAVSDPVLIRPDGTPLHLFCSIVDDLADDISHIVRGEEHVTGTGIQLDIARALGANPSRFSFAHVPPLTGGQGETPPRRFDGLSLRRLRTDGFEPAAVASYLARVGSADSSEPSSMAELAKTFSISGLGAAAARFDIAQLQAVNRLVLHATPFEAVADRLPAGATPAFWEIVRGTIDRLVEVRHWWDVAAGSFAPAPLDDAPFLADAARLLPPEPWDGDSWTTWTGALGDASGRTGQGLLTPLRLALTGEERGPEMQRLLPLIGRERAARRLRAAAP